MLLYNDWINNEIKKEIKKYLETNENEHTTTSKLWDVVKAVLTGKVIAIQSQGILTPHCQKWIDGPNNQQ